MAGRPNRYHQPPPRFQLPHQRRGNLRCSRRHDDSIEDPGGEGTINLAKAVIDTCAEPNSFAPIYDVNAPITEKIEAIAKTVYGARDVEYSEEAQEKLKIFITNGWDHLPICMAKTPLSLTDDAKIKGRPEGFTIHVRDLSISRGAGFVIAYTGAIMTMPGLPKDPAAVHMGIDEDGNSYGIF